MDIITIYGHYYHIWTYNPRFFSAGHIRTVSEHIRGRDTLDPAYYKKHHRIKHLGHPWARQIFAPQGGGEPISSGTLPVLITPTPGTNSTYEIRIQGHRGDSYPDWASYNTTVTLTVVRQELPCCGRQAPVGGVTAVTTINAGSVAIAWGNASGTLPTPAGQLVGGDLPLLGYRIYHSRGGWSADAPVVEDTGVV